MTSKADFIRDGVTICNGVFLNRFSISVNSLSTFDVSS